MRDANCVNCGAVLDFHKEKCLFCDTFIVDNKEQVGKAMKALEAPYYSESPTVTQQQLSGFMNNNMAAIMAGMGVIALTTLRR